MRKVCQGFVEILFCSTFDYKSLALLEKAVTTIVPAAVMAQKCALRSVLKEAAKNVLVSALKPVSILKRRSMAYMKYSSDHYKTQLRGAA